MTSLRHNARCLFACGLRASGALRAAKRQLTRRGAVMVLMVHRVLEDAELALTNSLPGIVVRKSTFEDLVSYCASRYKIVDVRDVAPDRSNGLQVAFTFDDGWTDTHRNAYPVLARHDAPFAVFVCPSLTGRKCPFWPERIAASMKAAQRSIPEVEAEIERMKSRAGVAVLDATDMEGIDGTMDWDEIQDLARKGVAIGSHTDTHRILTLLLDGEARAELRDSRHAIERRLNRRCGLFGYPNGNHTPRTRNLLVEAGFDLAFTTSRGAWTRETDVLAIPRANVCEDNVTGIDGRFSPALFEYAVFWNGWRAWRKQEIAQ